MPSLLVSGIKQGYLLSTFLFSLILEALVSEIMQEKEVKVIHIGRKSKTAAIFSVTVYVENPKKKKKKSTKKLPEQEMSLVRLENARLIYKINLMSIY